MKSAKVAVPISMRGVDAVAGRKLRKVTLPIAMVKTDGLGMETSPSMLAPSASGRSLMVKEEMLKPASLLRAARVTCLE